MPFTTKIDYSSNRQINQRTNNITVLSGGTSFGVTFSALTSGPDLTTSGITSSYSNLISSFSGNSGTTNYTWVDSRMSIANSKFSAITPTTSAYTQNSGSVYLPRTTTTIDGNIVNLEYSGVSFNISASTMVDLGSGSYSGTLYTTTLNIISANTSDYTGRTIWNDVSGISRTERIIITNNPIIGGVFTCIDSEGMGEWSILSGSTTYWSGGSGTYGIVQKNGNGNASGKLSVSEGSGTTASGLYTHAEGYNTTASGMASHAEGIRTTASGFVSHSEGYETASSGMSSHAEGTNSLANGDFSHAEGEFCIASGIASHAEGTNSLANGSSSHAEGSSSTASGSSSHAEGGGTTSIGSYSHTEGSSTTASGSCSHAGGYRAIANGVYSFVHGTGSTANGLSTIVLGNNVTGNTNNVVYVSDLIIDGLTSQDPIATNASGMIVAGTSDRRLKQNIEELNNSLEILKNLRGVSFEYTEASNMGGGIRYGFIAQEVQEIIPNIVRSRSKDEEMLSLNYTEIIPVIVEAIKELISGGVITQTERIIAEDNLIELNYNGTKETSLGGGIRVLCGLNNNSADLTINSDGDFITNNRFKPKELSIPHYKPLSSLDASGSEGDITRDEDYLYVKGINKWGRIKLEDF